MACCQVRSSWNFHHPSFRWIHCALRGISHSHSARIQFSSITWKNLLAGITQRVGVIPGPMGWQQHKKGNFWVLNQSARANQNTWMLPNKHQGNSGADECHWQFKLEHQDPKKCESPSRVPTKCSKFHFDSFFLWLLKLVSQMIQPWYIRKE